MNFRQLNLAVAKGALQSSARHHLALHAATSVIATQARNVCFGYPPLAAFTLRHARVMKKDRGARWLA